MSRRNTRNQAIPSHSIPARKNALTQPGPALAKYAAIAATTNANVTRCRIVGCALMDSFCQIRPRVDERRASTTNTQMLIATVRQNARRNDALSDLCRRSCSASTPPGHPPSMPRAQLKRCAVPVSIRATHAAIDLRRPVPRCSGRQCRRESSFVVRHANSPHSTLWTEVRAKPHMRGRSR